MSDTYDPNEDYVEIVLKLAQPAYQKIAQTREDVLETRAQLDRMDVIPSDEQVVIKALSLYHSIIQVCRAKVEKDNKNTKLRIVVDITELL